MDSSTGAQPQREQSAAACLPAHCWCLPSLPEPQGGAAFYVVARPLAVAELYRNCMAPMFQALNLNLRRLSVTARSAGGEPLLHRFVVCGAYNVATMFNM